jgi:uncharacterized membrane protein YtjA (UPF0391 family)
VSGGVFVAASDATQGTNRGICTLSVRSKKQVENRPSELGGLHMLYWLPRVCVLLFAVILIGFGLVPYTAAGVANTLLVIILGLGLLSLTLHVFPPEHH